MKAKHIYSLVFIAVIGLSSCASPRLKEYVSINWLYIKNAKMADGVFKAEYEYSREGSFSSLAKAPQTFRKHDKIIIQSSFREIPNIDELMSFAESEIEPKDVSKGTITVSNRKNLPIFVSDGKNQRLVWARDREAENEYVIIEGKKVYHKDYPEISLYALKQQSLEPKKKKEPGCR